MDDLEPLTVGERKLLEAVQTGALCDLSQENDVKDRTVRAAVLKAILSGNGKAWGIGAGAAIDLHGAVVSGHLGGFGGSQLPPIGLESCRFEDSVDFSGATLTGDASFHGSTFTGDARFDEATFTGDASFHGSTFTGDAGFAGALAHRLSFSRALFSAPDPGPWIASTISLDQTTLAVRSRISITAKTIDASRLQAREGAHLVLHCARVDLSDSEFVRRSIVSSLAVAEPIPPRPEIMPSQTSSPQMEARAAAAAAAQKFRDDLASELAGIPPRCRLTSLARANIGELVLSDVVLDDCAFAGGTSAHHGLRSSTTAPALPRPSSFDDGFAKYALTLGQRW